MITRRFPLERFREAFDLAVSGDESTMKILIDIQ